MRRSSRNKTQPKAIIEPKQLHSLNDDDCEADQQDNKTQKSQDDDDRSRTPDYIKPFFSDDEDDEESIDNSGQEVMANDDAANDINTNDDQNELKSRSVRRSTRSLGKERKVYQVESSTSSSSSSSSESYHHESSSESDDNSDDYEPSDVDASEDDDEEEEHEHEHEHEPDKDNERIDSSLVQASISAAINSLTKLTNSTHVVSNCFDDDTESISNETEIGGEETNKVEQQKCNESQFEVLSLKCSECSADFKDKFALNDHLLSRHQIRQYRCMIRGCETVSFHLLKQLTQEHNKIKHGKQSNWSCALCPLALSSYEKLAKHVTNHHREGKFKCKLCNFESNTTRNGMKRHFANVHSANEEHPCQVEGCGKVFKSNDNLVRHAVCHSSEKPFACSQCEKSFKSKEILTTHIKGVHQRLRPFKCNWPECRFSALTSAAVERHAKGVHHQIRPFKCKWLECSFASANAGNVEMHIKRMHFVAGDKRNAKDFVKKEEQQPETSSNKRKNVNSEQIAVNKRIRENATNGLNSGQESEDDRDYDSDSADSNAGEVLTRSQTSNTQVGYNPTEGDESGSETEIDEDEPNETEKQKIRELNFEVLSLRCSECSDDFDDKLKLNGHLLACHQISQFRCFARGCESVSFDLHKQLTQQHNRTKHGKQPNWPCALCTSTLSSYTDLSKHVLKYHQEGKFKCKLCDFESQTTRETMMRHLRNSHPTIDSYRCTVEGCNNVYKTKGHLVRHSATSHTNEKAFSCSQCEKCFKLKGDLVKHVQNVHLRIRPFKCKWTDCRGYEAPSSSAVEIHIKRIHFVAGDKRNAKDFVEKQELPETSNKKGKNSEPKVVKKRIRKKVNPDPDKQKKTNVIVVWLNCPIDGCVEHRPNLVQLNAHILECHQIEQYRCLVRDCAQSFKYCEQYRLHKVQHDQSETALECPKCDYSTAKYSSLFYHYYQYHEEGRFACNQPNCDFVSDTCRQPMNGHTYTHKPLKYKCTVEGCSEAFKENKLLRNHVKSHQNEVNRFSGCPHCGRTDFIRSNSFTEHVNSHARKSGGYRCAWKVKGKGEPCGWFSTNVTSVQDHVRGQHLNANSKGAQDLNKYLNKVFPNKKRVKTLRKSSKAARSKAAAVTDDDDESD